MGFPNYLRQRNIFDPMNQMQGPPIDFSGGAPDPDILPIQPDFGGNQPLQNPGPQLPPAPPDFDPMASYHPEHAAIDAYTQLMSQYPQEMQVSGKRRIGASILGALTDLGTNLGGPRHAAGQRTGPKGMDVFNEMTGKNQYLEAIQDWKNRIGPAGTAANLERYSNANERQVAYQTGQQKLASDKEKALEAAKERTAKIQEERNKILDFKANNPDLKFDVTGPYVKVMDPGTGKVSELKDMPTGNLSDSDKLRMQHINKTEEIHTTAEEARQTAPVVAETRGWKTYNITDPDDPTKTIAVSTNEVTGETKRVTLDDKGVGPLTRPGTKLPGTEDNTKLQGIQDQARETIAEIDALMDKNGEHLNDEAKTAVGASRMFQLHRLPGGMSFGSRAADVRINRIKSEMIVKLIGDMKAQSKTGATGFGQLNMKELAVLESAASKLDPYLDEETFTSELLRIREKLNKILQPATSADVTKTKKPPLTEAPPPPIPNTHYEQQPNGHWKLFPNKG